MNKFKISSSESSSSGSTTVKKRKRSTGDDETDYNPNKTRKGNEGIVLISNPNRNPRLLPVHRFPNPRFFRPVSPPSSSSSSSNATSVATNGKSEDLDYGAPVFYEKNFQGKFYKATKPRIFKFPNAIAEQMAKKPPTPRTKRKTKRVILK